MLGRYAERAKALKFRASQRLHVLVWAHKTGHPIRKLCCVLPESLSDLKVLAWRRAWGCRFPYFASEIINFISQDT